MNSHLSTPNSQLSAIYRRVSTDHQDNSLALQEQRVLNYAAYKGLEVSEGLTFCDPDTSGRTPILDRAGGRALLNRLKHGDVKHLLVAKLDRLGRNVRDGLKTIEFLKEHGIVLHITDFGGESFSTQGHVGKFFLTMLLAISEWEVEEIRDRTLKVARSKFDRNELTGNVPFGFDCIYTFADGHEETTPKVFNASQLSTLESQHGACQSKLLEPNNEEQHVIRLMHQRRHTPHGTRLTTPLQLVADRLNENGYRTKQGSLWSAGTVDSVLNSRHTQKVLSAPSESSDSQADIVQTSA